MQAAESQFTAQSESPNNFARDFERNNLRTLADIAVQLSQLEFPISIDGLYARLQKPRGILRWDLEVPAERFGEKAFDVEYSYSTEFDRNQMLTAIQPKEQLESDYLEFSTPSGSMGGGMGGMGGFFRVEK